MKYEVREICFDHPDYPEYTVGHEICKGFFEIHARFKNIEDAELFAEIKNKKEGL